MVSGRYLLNRLSFSLVTLFLSTSVAFFILNVIPGDLAYRILGEFATPERLAELRAQLGLNESIALRYVKWLAALIQGDLGDGAFSGQPVANEVLRRLPVTLELAIAASLFGMIFGIPIGLLSAIKPGSMTDSIVRPLSILGLAVPSFWIALMVLIFPSLLWNYSPPRYASLLENPRDNLQLMMPAAAILGLAFMASVARLTRTSMLEVIREDFMRTARAKGLRSRDVILKHGLRNALIPVITLSSLQFATVLGGTVIIESIFSLPGLGSMVIRSIVVRDFPLLQGFVVLMVVVYVTVNLAVDVFASLLDPRIRLD